MMSPSLFFSWLLPFLFPALVSTHPTATGSPATGQNLTSYLLTTHATIYQQAISAPAFFAQVRNGTVEPGRVAFFFEQDVLYGRGFTALTGTALSLVVANETVELASPQENLTLSVVDGWGQTASGLSDEGGRLIEARAGILGGLSQQQQAMAEVSCPSQGTREYVQFMQGVSYWGKRDGFAGLVCAWVMGKAFIDIWTGIQTEQVHKPNKIPQLQDMIDYWADPSYVAAVNATAELVDQWYATVQEDVSVADEVFVQTLDRETGFWASVDAWNGEEGC